MPKQIKLEPQTWNRVAKSHQAMQKMHWHAHQDWHVLRFDGSCLDNGTQHAKGGYGWALWDRNGRLIKDGYGRADGKPVTVNVAEWQGLIAGLDAMQPMNIALAGLAIEGDSKLVVNCLSGTWKCHQRTMADFRDEAIQLIADLSIQWSINWIPRDDNEHCDELSNQSYSGQ